MLDRPTEQERRQQFTELLAKLQTWDIPDAAVETVHDAARASMNEVKSLTEYEDGKISRLMTVVAFLSAVVGAVFTRFASEYRWPGFSAFAWGPDWLLPAATYTTFFLYVVIVTASVLVLLGAIRPTFNVPDTWKGRAHAGLPRSMLFYQGILGVTAPKWAEAFEQTAGADGALLKKYYAKCYITEAYLIAEKVALKLRVASRGVCALQFAMGILLLFFLLFWATTFLVCTR
jgi:hypothetical protein